jgi:Winged helix DNA-binding domain
VTNSRVARPDGINGAECAGSAREARSEELTGALMLPLTAHAATDHTHPSGSSRRCDTTRSRLYLTRTQILAFRRHVGALDQRLPRGARSLRRAAWAGLQDSMPRAALLSIHARVEGTEPSTWEDPSLVQLWGPRYNSYVVAARDLAIFSLGRLPDDVKGRRLAEDLAASLHALLGGTRMNYSEAGRALGVHPNALRYAAPTGRAMIRWDGARLPTIWTVPPPGLDPSEARLELTRRYLHVFGPAAPEAFAGWAGISARGGVAAFDALRRSLIPVRTPVGDAWILTRDEPTFRAAVGRAAAARLLPSGDAYFLLQGADRELLVVDADRRRALWTPRVWPGGLLVRGELVGTWRRAHGTVTVHTWRRLSRAARDLVEAEARSLPLAGITGRIVVRWDH